jgi:ATP-dependent Lhr-like helicase
MSLSPELAGAVRRKLEEAARGVFKGAEMEAVRPLLELQAAWSKLPASDETVVERLVTREGQHLLVYPFEGRAVHEGLASLLAYRMSRVKPLSFTFACNDYGFELLSPETAPFGDGLWLFSSENLAEDIAASLNTAEIARRYFRSVARVAGLVFGGFPGAGKTIKQMQMSSGLLYDVFARHDPDNLLLRQAARESLEHHLEAGRLEAALERIRQGRLTVIETARPTPLAFPLIVDRMRERLSSEKLADRVRRMQLKLEAAAG